MQILKADTQVIVRVGPFVDSIDGVTPETGVTLGAADQAELLKHNGTATVDISMSTWAAIIGCDGWYDLTLTMSNTDTEGLLTIVIQDSSVCLPVFANFMVVNANVYNSLYAVAAADYLQVDVIQISGDTQSATDLKDFVDAGYDPATNKVQGVVLTDTCTTLTGNVGGSVASVVGAVGSVTAGVTVTTNNDKTGYSLSAAAVQAIWDALTSALTTVGSIGKKLADWVTGTIDTYTGNTKQTGDSFVRLGVPAGVSISADVAAVKADTAAILVDTGTTLEADLDAILADTNELQTDWHDGGRLDVILDDAASADDPWITALPGAYGAGTAGKIIGDNINAPISTVDTVVDAVKVVTDKVATAIELDGAVYRYTSNALELAPSGGASVAEIADGVWDEAAADHVAAGSTGKKLNDVVGAVPVNIQTENTTIVGA